MYSRHPLTDQAAQNSRSAESEGSAPIWAADVNDDGIDKAPGGFSDHDYRVLQADKARAKAWMQAALQCPDDSLIWQLVFGAISPKLKAKVRRRLARFMEKLPRAKFRRGRKRYIAATTNRLFRNITLHPAHFSGTDEKRACTIIHELAHLHSLAGDKFYISLPPDKYRLFQTEAHQPRQLVNNADSLANFCFEVARARH